MVRGRMESRARLRAGRLAPEGRPAGLRAGFLAALLAFLALLPAGPGAAEPAGRLAPLASLRGAPVTVSGLSSGGFFAHQMHVAYSARIEGAGIVAGGPFACAEQSPWWLAANPLRRVVVALTVCSTKGRGAFGWWEAWLPAAPSGEAAAAAIRAAHARGAVDDPKHLARSRVWLFSGGRDDVVPPAGMEAVRVAYERLGLAAPNLVVRHEAGAAHGLPIAEFVGDSPFPKRACGTHGEPFLIDCDFDAALLILRHLHPDGFDARPRGADPARFLRFDQAEFAPGGVIGLGPLGTLYVPESCAGETERCRLHVAFHGCKQYEAAIGDVFVRHAGYDAYAEANRLVVLYPQAARDPVANPEGCWDWWGYAGPDYATRHGPQMRAVKAMIDRLTGG